MQEPTRSTTAAAFLIRHVRPYLPILLAGILFSGLSILCHLGIPWITAHIIDDAITAKNRALLASYTLALAVDTIGLVLFSVFANLTFALLGGKALADIQTDMLRNAQTLSMKTHQGTKVGEVVALFDGDAVSCGEFYEHDLSQMVEGTIQVVSTLLILFTLYPDLAVYLLIAIPGYVLLTAPLGGPIRRASRAFRTNIAEIGGQVQESLLAIREIKSFNRQDWNLNRLVPAFRRLLGSRLRLRALRDASNINVMAFWLVACCVYWFGGLRVLSGGMTLGSLVALLSYCQMLQQPFVRFVNLYSEIQVVFGSADRIIEYLSKEDPPREPRGTARLIPGPGRLEFDQVCFGYERGTPVIHDVSFTVPAGQRLAIIGPSGSGKSTLLRLLLGLHQPSSGRILIDGEDIRHLSRESLRDNIGVVFEETLLFSTSIRQNILFGRLDASQSEVATAARLANAEGFVLALPEGFETPVGERGLTLSNGQKQRLAIARAILRDPRVLILDEATSALDPEAERSVSQALEKLMKGRTTLNVTHRVWTVGGFDSLVVLDQGRLIDSGGPEELLQRCELYRRLLASEQPANP